MSWSSSSPPMRRLRLTTIPPRLMTATSVVPPPMSTMRLPVGSPTGKPAPIAAAIGSSISRAHLAPALSAASRTARFSTSVTPLGMPISIRGRGIMPTRSCTLRTKYLIICSVTSKSLITPSRSGRTAMMLAGVRPSIRLASAPMASTRLVRASMATTEGSLITMPRSRTWTSVLAVPRSIPISRENMPRKLSSIPMVVSLGDGASTARVSRSRGARRSLRSVYRRLATPAERGIGFTLAPIRREARVIPLRHHLSAGRVGTGSNSVLWHPKRVCLSHIEASKAPDAAI